MDYANLAKEIHSKVGGNSNINGVVFCSTRLRFTLKDDGLADVKGLKETDGVLTVIQSQGQCQVVIGNDVPLVFAELEKLLPENVTVSSEADEPEVQQMTEHPVKKKKLFDRVMSVIAGIFVPYVPVIAASGILRGFLIMFNSFGWISSDAPLYIILYAAGNAVFYFLPILLAYTAAKQFKADPFIGAVIGAALLEPNMSLLGGAGESFSLFGIPTVVYDFGNTVVPVIIAMFVYGYLYRFLMKHIPSSLKQILTAVICLVVMLPLTILVFGPVGMTISNAVANVYTSLNAASPILSGAFVGGFFIFLTLFGCNMALVPIVVNNIAVNGLDTLNPAWTLINYATLGVTLCYMVRSKNKAQRNVASAASLSLILSGISEPGLYGICIQHKKTFISIIIGGFVGGAICGGFGCTCTSFGMAGILGLSAFYSPQFLAYIVSCVVAVAVSFVVTFIMGVESDPVVKA